MAEGDTKPLVSVCMPAYNHAHTLGHALRSAMSQTYRNFEILVLDNGSTDDTESLVGALSRQDSRIRYLRHPENIGMIRNFNRCIEQANGEYIKFVCADDMIEPDCVEQMVRVMFTHPEVSLVGCARQMVDQDLYSTGTAQYSRHFTVVEGTSAIRRCFFGGNVIGEPTAVMFRRADAVRGFDDRYQQLMDLEMWFRLLKRGAFAFLPTPLCRIRKHVEQATQKNLKAGIVLRDKRLLFREFASEVGKHAGLAERLLWDARMAVTVWRTRNAGHAIRLEDIEEVFFPRLFPALTYPAASTLTRLLDRK
jgi:glycosyltransferase involved in cell wall biosynthesis